MLLSLSWYAVCTITCSAIGVLVNFTAPVKACPRSASWLPRHCKKTFPGLATQSHVDTGSHDISGTVSVDEDEERPAGVPYIGVSIDIDGNYAGLVDVTVYLNNKHKTFKSKATDMRAGMLLEALTALNTLLATKYKKGS
jgi:hypothetical protein